MMPIQVNYHDLRDDQAIMENFIIDWYETMTAEEAIGLALSPERAEQVINDLAQNIRDVFINWYNENYDGEYSMGGVKRLDWHIDNWSILYILYQNEKTSQRRIDESMDYDIWHRLVNRETMKRVEVDFNWRSPDGLGVYIRDEYMPDDVLEGIKVILYDPNDIEVDAVIERLSIGDVSMWYAIFDGEFRYI